MGVFVMMTSRQILKENNWVTLENSWSYKGNWVVFKRKWFFPTMKNLSSSAPHQIQIDRLVINSAHMTKETNDGSFFIFHIQTFFNIKGRSSSFPIVFSIMRTREFFEGFHRSENSFRPLFYSRIETWDVFVWLGYIGVCFTYYFWPNVHACTIVKMCISAQGDSALENLCLTRTKVCSAAISPKVVE